MRLFLFIQFLCFSPTFAQPTSLLDSAYNYKSTKVFSEFLNSWQILPKDTTELENDTIIDIFDLFTAFYKPNNLSEYNGNGVVFQNKFNEYVIVPGELNYSISYDISPLQPQNVFQSTGYVLDNYKTLIDNQKILSISNFRPQIKVDSSIILVLTPSYKAALLSFLGPAWINGKKNELAYVKTYWLEQICGIRVRYNKYGGGFSTEHEQWIILSSPQVTHIFIDESLTTASVFFTIEDLEIGVAYFKKQEGVWIRTELMIECTDCD